MNLYKAITVDDRGYEGVRTISAESREDAEHQLRMVKPKETVIGWVGDDETINEMMNGGW